MRKRPQQQRNDFGREPSEHPRERAATRHNQRHAPQRSGYYETAGPDDNRASLYGRPERNDDPARSDFGGAAGTQSGYESPHGHRGKRPRNHARSDQLIREDLCERLLEDNHIDPSEIEVSVEKGIVTLYGAVEQRWIKHGVEDLAEACCGMKDIVNNLRVVPGGRAPRKTPGAT